MKYWLQSKKFPIDLTFSINPLGPPLKVKKKIKFDISQYPSGNEELIELLSKKFSVPKENILLHSGVNDLINLICLMFLKKNEIVLIPKVTYPRYEEAVNNFGGQVIFVPMKKNLRIDFKAFERKIKKLANRVKLIFFANPNNPTGLVEGKNKILRLKRLTKALIVIDEAGIDFVDEKKFSLIKEAARSKNLLVLRTFSKSHGMAGLRIGFAVGPLRFIEKLKIAKSPFPISLVAKESAILALKDTKHLKKTKEFFKRELSFFKRELEKLGFEVLPPESTNIFAKIPPLFSSAKEFIKELNKKGANCVDGAFFYLPDYIRVCPRNKATNRKFVAIIKKILKEKIKFSHLKGLKKQC